MSPTGEHAKANRAEMTAVLCAGAAAAIGATAILGWNLGSERLIAVRGEYIPLQYNTAVAFLCCSLAVLALVSGRQYLATVAAAIVFLLATTTAIEFLAAVNLPIDTVLFNQLVADNIPGRMAPNTVAGFVCVSAALMLLAWRSRWRYASEVAASLCAFVAAVGAVAFTGYLANIPSAYEWSPGHPIAALTTIGFPLLGAAGIAAAWDPGGDRRRSLRWLPTPVFVLLMSVCGMIAKALWDTSRIAGAAQPRHSLVFAMALVLAFGLAVSSMVVGLMRLAQETDRKSRELAAVNRALDEEMVKTRKAAHYVRSLIEACVDPLVTISREGKITDVNRATEAATGRTREELIGSDFCDYFTDPEKARAGYESVFAHDMVRDYPLAMRHVSGSITEVLYNAAVYRGEQGENEGVFAAAHDVTELKRAEAAVAESEERYRSLVIATAQVVWMTDPQGLVAGDMPTWREFTGATVEQLQGWGWLESLHPEDRERTARRWTESVQRRALYETEYRLRRADGQYRDVWVRGVPILKTDGDIREWVGTCTDITARKQAQQELERSAEELKRSNSELQEFAFVASHDLQEPLRKITAFSERLRDRASAQLDETSLDYLNRMHNAAGRMGALINSLLEYSRVSTRAQPFEAVDFAALVVGVLSDVEQRMRESKARVVVHALPNVEGDAMQLRQLIQNLVGNALKFHAPDTAPEIHITSQRSHGRWKVSISDNGIGFEPVYAQKIFRPFQRLHGRNEYEGSGMGLAICRKVAQRHGADIEVQSAPGKGATFTISLPAAPERNQPCPKPRSESSSPKTMTMTTC